MTQKVWTAAEFDKLSHTERKAVFDASIVTDLSAVRPAFLAVVRSDVEAFITEADRREASLHEER